MSAKRKLSAKRQQTAKQRRKRMPSGGRRRTTWTKATRPKSPGRKGAKDRVPRSFRGSIKAIFEEVASEDPKLIYDAVIRGLKAPAPKSFQYLQLVTAYIDGKPTDAVPVDQVRRVLQAVGFLFLDVVGDVALRRKFFEGLRRLVDVDQGAIVDAHALQKSAQS